MNIRDDLKARRKECGYNLEETASEGCSRFTISRFEKGGDISLSSLEILCENLHTPLRLMRLPIPKKDK